jgi:hypothetical protein
MYHQPDTLKGADLGLHSRRDSSNYGFKKEKKRKSRRVGQNWWLNRNWTTAQLVIHGPVQLSPDRQCAPTGFSCRLCNWGWENRT